MNFFLSVIATVLVCLQSLFSASWYIAPDFQLSQLNISPLFSIVSMVVTIILLASFFILLFVDEPKFSKFLLKVFSSFSLSIFFSLISLFVLSFYLNGLRCQHSGFCVSGEPYDYMSTIFLVIILAPALLVIYLLVLITALILRCFNQLRNEDISFKGKVFILFIISILLTYQFDKLRPNLKNLFEYHPALSASLSELIEKCQPYDHCEDETIDIQETIGSIDPQAPAAQLTNFQKWSIALGGMLVEMNHMPHGQLSVLSPRYNKTLEISRVKNMLKGSWDIFDRKSTLETLSWLANEGHSVNQYREFYLAVKNNPGLSAGQLYDKIIADYEAYYGEDPTLHTQNSELKEKQIAAYEFVIKNKDKTGNNLIYAWDYGRFVFVARSAYSVGYLTEAETLVLIEEVGKRVRGRFSSWQDFADNYAIGRLWWASGISGAAEETQSVINRLFSSEGQWTKIPWDWSKED